MKLEGIELIRATVTLRAPFRASFGFLHERDLLLVRAVSAEAEGWGECIAFNSPMYSSEYTEGVVEALRRFLVPLLLESESTSAELIGEILGPIRGHRMAKAVLETAVLDAQLREWGTSFGTYLGAVRDRVPAGVSIGIQESIPELLSIIDQHLHEGYSQIKLKIAPGWDVEPLTAVRERFDDKLPLQVDANASYTLADSSHLARLDELGLLMIEQPLGEDQLHQHSLLAQRIGTPIALDESIKSAAIAAEAIAMGACQLINIKPGRVGGYLESRRIHDLCRANGTPVWCGGMAETGIGRAGNVALAAMPGFIPGDNSASARYYADDITEPFLLVDGHLRVPTGPGFGVVPKADRIAAITKERIWIGV